jgi:hypothetical protein
VWAARRHKRAKLRYNIPPSCLPVVALALSLSVVGRPTVARAQKRPANGRPPASLRVLSAEKKTSLSVNLVGVTGGAAVLGRLPGAWSLDLGSVSYAGVPGTSNVVIKRFPGSFVVSTEFGLEIHDPTQHLKTVSVLAFLGSPQSRVTIRIDGVRLQAIPQGLATHVPTSLISRHRLEIEVPINLTGDVSLVANSIEFSVVPD